VQPALRSQQEAVSAPVGFARAAAVRRGGRGRPAADLVRPVALLVALPMEVSAQPVAQRGVRERPAVVLVRQVASSAAFALVGPDGLARRGAGLAQRAEPFAGSARSAARPACRERPAVGLVQPVAALDGPDARAVDPVRWRAFAWTAEVRSARPVARCGLPQAAEVVSAAWRPAVAVVPGELLPAVAARLAVLPRLAAGVRALRPEAAREPPPEVSGQASRPEALSFLPAPAPALARASSRRGPIAAIARPKATRFRTEWCRPSAGDAAYSFRVSFGELLFVLAPAESRPARRTQHNALGALMVPANSGRCWSPGINQVAEARPSRARGTAPLSTMAFRPA
jgi:hypothetical protein